MDVRLLASAPPAPGSSGDKCPDAEIRTYGGRGTPNITVLGMRTENAFLQLIFGFLEPFLRRLPELCQEKGL